MKLLDGECVDGYTKICIQRYLVLHIFLGHMFKHKQQNGINGSMGTVLHRKYCCFEMLPRAQHSYLLNMYT